MIDFALINNETDYVNGYQVLNANIHKLDTISLHSIQFNKIEVAELLSFNNFNNKMI